MRPTDALVTGFCKSPLVTEKSFAPLRRLRQEGHLRAIHYVTWDNPEIDACVAPVTAMDDVTVTRVPQPDARGTPGERGVVYQVENLRAGLALLPPDGLVLKLRPDFVASARLLRDKIVRFEQFCAPVRPHRAQWRDDARTGAGEQDVAGLVGFQPAFLLRGRRLPRHPCRDARHAAHAPDAGGPRHPQ